jgi:alpha-1,3-mannosyltransferase
VLRLFNDPIAMILTYVAINCFLNGRWTMGSLSYSLAVSVKMNVLLYAPALLTIFLTQLTLFDTIVQLAVCGSLQVVLALPFLIVNPWSYLSRSFDLGRVFLYEWTVNWKFLPEEYFLNRWFHVGLLVLHLGALALFLNPWLKYLKSHYNLKSFAESAEGRKALQIRSQLMLYPLFVSNFIGICFSRSLHYQFYVWYYHTIPYLLWSTKLPTQLKLVIFGLIELCWNIFPATALSSATLQICHLCILGGLWQYTSPQKDWKVKLKNR